MCADAGTFVSTRLSENSSNHSGRSRKRFPAACWLSSFLFWLWVLGGLDLCPYTLSSVRKLAGIEKVDESCGNDVENELVLELDDKSRDNDEHEMFRLA